MTYTVSAHLCYLSLVSIAISISFPLHFYRYLHILSSPSHNIYYDYTNGVFLSLRLSLYRPSITTTRARSFHRHLHRTISITNIQAQSFQQNRSYIVLRTRVVSYSIYCLEQPWRRLRPYSICCLEQPWRRLRPYSICCLEQLQYNSYSSFFDHFYISFCPKSQGCSRAWVGGKHT